MGMVDSNTNPDNYLYHFFGNDDSLENIEFFFEFIKDALKEGRIKEQEYFFYLILSKIKTKLQERNNYLNIKNQVIKN
jgi:ribosomal protein S2